MYGRVIIHSVRVSFGDSGLALSTINILTKAKNICCLSGLFKVNLEMPIFGSDLENEISVCVRNWELKTLILGC